MTSSSEPSQKFVVLVTIETGENASTPPKWEPIEIRTRRVLTFPCIRHEGHIESFRQEINTALLACQDKKPMIVSSYVRSMTKNIEAFQSSLEDLGITLIRFTPEPDVMSVEAVVEDRAVQSTSMSEIISETPSLEQQEKDLACRLWSMPLMAEAVIEQFMQSVRERHHENQPA